jgi:hypothetical protein
LNIHDYQTQTWSKNAVSITIWPTDVFSHFRHDNILDKSENWSNLVGKPACNNQQEQSIEYEFSEIEQQSKLKFDVGAI